MRRASERQFPLEFENEHEEPPFKERAKRRLAGFVRGRDEAGGWDVLAGRGGRFFGGFRFYRTEVKITFEKIFSQKLFFPKPIHPFEIINSFYVSFIIH